MFDIGNIKKVPEIDLTLSGHVGKGHCSWCSSPTNLKNSYGVFMCKACQQKGKDHMF